MFVCLYKTDQCQCDGEDMRVTLQTALCYSTHFLLDRSLTTDWLLYVNETLRTAINNLHHLETRPVTWLTQWRNEGKTISDPTETTITFLLVFSSLLWLWQLLSSPRLDLTISPTTLDTTDPTNISLCLLRFLSTRLLSTKRSPILTATSTEFMMSTVGQTSTLTRPLMVTVMWRAATGIFLVTSD